MIACIGHRFYIDWIVSALIRSGDSGWLAIVTAWRLFTPETPLIDKTKTLTSLKLVRNLRDNLSGEVS